MGRNDPKCTAPRCTFRAVADQGLCVRHGGVRPVRPTADAPIDAPGMRVCGATTRDGGRCKQPARRGGTRCRIHGGSAPQVERKAAERVAEASLAEIARHYGVPRDVAPANALREELARTQGHVDFLEREVASRPLDGQLLAVYTAERAHLAKLADAMVRTRLDERRTVLTEQTVEGMEMALTSILRELGHDPGSAFVRGVIARNLRAITGPSQSSRDAVLDAEVVRDDALPSPWSFDVSLMFATV